MLLLCYKHLYVLAGIRVEKRLKRLSFVADCVVTKKYILANSAMHAIRGIRCQMISQLFCALLCALYKEIISRNNNGDL